MNQIVHGLGLALGLCCVVASCRTQVVECHVSNDCTASEVCVGGICLTGTLVDGGVVLGEGEGEGEGEACVPDSDALFCDRAQKECGPATGTDNCSRFRQVDECGPCANGGCLDGACCVAESDGAFCLAEGAECGSVSGTDLCGEPRSVASCGLCGGTELCQGNQCIACTPQSDAELCNNIVNADDLGDKCGSFGVTDRCGQSRNVVCSSCVNGRNCDTGSGRCSYPSCGCFAGGQSNCGDGNDACNNFCHRAGGTGGCPMVQSGGYCARPSTADFSQGDWNRGFNEYAEQCN